MLEWQILINDLSGFRCFNDDHILGGAIEVHAYLILIILE